MDSPKSANNDFLKKLREITEANFTNAQFGVSALAKEMGMSRVTLHRKVNAITKNTASQFINQVRLKKAKEILRHTSDTVSEVAYKVGFSNVSYFIKCFHDFYGFPPGKVGNREDDEANQQNRDAGKKKLSLLILSVSAIFILIIVLFVFFNPFIPNPQKPISLAVLPFTDESPDKKHSYIVNGIRDDIHSKLGKIRDLRVISNATSDMYKGSDLSIKEIAKELHANYILSAKVQVIQNKVKVNPELIDASTGYNLWSDRYQKGFDIDNPFSLTEEIAFDVAKAIKVKITSTEKELMEIRPTDNPEAWNSYMVGMDFYNRALDINTWWEKDTINMQNAIKYFEDALKFDNKFGLANARIALVYCWHNSFNDTNMYIDQIIRHIDKAQSNSTDHEEPWLATAGYYYITREYNDAVLFLEKALEINPNSIRAIDWLARIYRSHLDNEEKNLEYSIKALNLGIQSDDNTDYGYEYAKLSDAYRRAGFFEEAHTCINKALEINHSSLHHICKKADLNIVMGNYEQVEKDLLQVYNIDSTHLDANFLLGRLYCYTGNYSKSYKYYKNVVKIRENEDYSNIRITDNVPLGFVTAQIGLSKESELYFNKFMNNNQKMSALRKSWRLAGVYAFKGEKEKAIELLKNMTPIGNFDYYILYSLEKHPIYDNLRNMDEFNLFLKELRDVFEQNHSRIRKSLKKQGLL